MSEIISGDCLEVMKNFEDNHFDLVLTDPPYGIGESNEKNQTRGKLAKTTDYGHYEWDKKLIDKEYLSEIFRVSKNQIIFGGNFYGDFLGSTNCWIVWDKRNGNNDFADCELAWTSFDRAVRKYEWLWNGMIRKNNEKRYHPTQKPIGLFKNILKDFSSESDLILDPFLGSGTTAVACKILGRNYIGIEKEEQYIKIARERLENTQGRKRGLEAYCDE